MPRREQTTVEVECDRCGTTESVMEGGLLLDWHHLAAVDLRLVDASSPPGDPVLCPSCSKRAAASVDAPVVLRDAVRAVMAGHGLTLHPDEGFVSDLYDVVLAFVRHMAPADPDLLAVRDRLVAVLDRMHVTREDRVLTPHGVGRFREEVANHALAALASAGVLTGEGAGPEGATGTVEVRVPGQPVILARPGETVEVSTPGLIVDDQARMALDDAEHVGDGWLHLRREDGVIVPCRIDPTLVRVRVHPYQVEVDPQGSLDALVNTYGHVGVIGKVLESVSGHHARAEVLRLAAGDAAVADPSSTRTLPVERTPEDELDAADWWEGLAKRLTDTLGGLPAHQAGTGVRRLAEAATYVRDRLMDEAHDCRLAAHEGRLQAAAPVAEPDEVARFRQHSETLNAVGYRMALALRKIEPPREYHGDVSALLDELLEDRQASHRALQRTLEALRLTVEHVGVGTLPPVAGWSWYDEMSRHPAYAGWLRSMTETYDAGMEAWAADARARADRGEVQWTDPAAVRARIAELESELAESRETIDLRVDDDPEPEWTARTSTETVVAGARIRVAVEMLDDVTPPDLGGMLARAAAAARGESRHFTPAEDVAAIYRHASHIGGWDDQGKVADRIAANRLVTDPEALAEARRKLAEGFDRSADDLDTTGVLCDDADGRTIRDGQGNVRAVIPDVVVHATPNPVSLVASCCGRTPFELPHTDRISNDPDAVTCNRSGSSYEGLSRNDDEQDGKPPSIFDAFKATQPSPMSWSVTPPTPMGGAFAPGGHVARPTRPDTTAETAWKRHRTGDDRRPFLRRVADWFTR